jgi:hypothetical protein
MKPIFTVACIFLKSVWQAVCQPFLIQLRRLSSLRPALTALLFAPLSALRSADPPDTNYDESKVPSYILPEALVCFDVQAVEDTKRWREKRRSEFDSFTPTE